MHKIVWFFSVVWGRRQELFPQRGTEDFHGVEAKSLRLSVEPDVEPNSCRNCSSACGWRCAVDGQWLTEACYASARHIRLIEHQWEFVTDVEWCQPPEGQQAMSFLARSIQFVIQQHFQVYAGLQPLPCSMLHQNLNELEVPSTICPGHLYYVNTEAQAEVHERLLSLLLSLSLFPTVCFDMLSSTLIINQ